MAEEVEIEIIDNNNSPSRLLVAEFMVLNNFVAASYAAEHRIPIIYRVQPSAGDAGVVRARLSVYPEFHAGAGLQCYAQLSSPIRRYADLVLQRQLVSALADSSAPPYDADEILAVLANTENAEAEAKELERRARRYWTLRYLQRHAVDRELAATVTRDGASAELDDYAVRGALRGAVERFDADADTGPDCSGRPAARLALVRLSRDHAKGRRATVLGFPSSSHEKFWEAWAGEVGRKFSSAEGSFSGRSASGYSPDRLQLRRAELHRSPAVQSMSEKGRAACDPAPESVSALEVVLL